MLSVARVIEKEELAERCYYLLLLEPRLARQSMPGQFIHIRVGESYMPLLRRPFSVAGASPESGTVQVFFRVVGGGTRLLSALRRDDSIDCLGPLGNGFKSGRVTGPSVLVAGGIGVAPLLFLARCLVREQKKVILFYGAQSSGELLPVKRFLPSGVEINLAAEDGSTGYAGTVTAAFSEAVERGLRVGEMFACGPRPMLKEIVGLNRQKWSFPLQVSLEENMACGVGACRGCAVAVKGSGESAYQRVCREGPVFDAAEVVL